MGVVLDGESSVEGVVVATADKGCICGGGERSDYGAEVARRAQVRRVEIRDPKDYATLEKVTERIMRDRWVSQRLRVHVQEAVAPDRHDNGFRERAVKYDVAGRFRDTLPPPDMA